MIAIEPTTEADWPIVQALLRDTPMTARVPLAIERRGSEAHAFPMLGGGKVLSYVARDSGRIIGYVHAALQDRLVPGEGGRLVPETLLFGSDLRVDPAYRRQGLAHRLLAAAGTAALEAGVKRGFGYVNEGNNSALALREGLKGSTIVPVRTFVTTTRMFVFPPKRGGELPRVEPTEQAFVHLAERLASRVLAPIVTPGDLVELARSAPEIVWVGEDGRVDLALWDQHDRRCLRLLGKLPFGIAATLGAWRLASRLSGTEPPPGPGGAWRSFEVALVADPAAALRHAGAIAAFAAASGAHFVNAIDDGAGPPWPGPKRQLRTQVLVFGMDGAPPPAIPPDRTLHVDLGFF